MKLVSAAKLRRAQTAILHLRPYSNKLNEILGNLTSDSETMESMPLFEKREPEKIVIVVLTSNKGLCGSFNSNIIKAVNKLITAQYATQTDNNNVQLICIGKKGKDQLSKQYPILASYENILDTRNFTELSQIADMLMEGFLNHKFDKIDIIYNQFVNAATQRITVENFLPVVNLQDTVGEQKIRHDYLIEPSRQEVLTELIPKILRTQLYKTLTDSIASEHGARMVAMTQATDNATEILKELRLKYNNARQSSITNELIEIVSGAEALKN